MFSQRIFQNLIISFENAETLQLNLPKDSSFLFSWAARKRKRKNQRTHGNNFPLDEQSSEFHSSSDLLRLPALNYWIVLSFSLSLFISSAFKVAACNPIYFMLSTEHLIFLPSFGLKIDGYSPF